MSFFNKHYAVQSGKKEPMSGDAVLRYPDILLPNYSKHLKYGIWCLKFRKEFDRLTSMFQKNIEDIAVKHNSTASPYVRIRYMDDMSYLMDDIFHSVRATMNEAPNHYFWLYRNMPGVSVGAKNFIVEQTQRATFAMSDIIRSYENLYRHVLISSDIWPEMADMESTYTVQGTPHRHSGVLLNFQSARMMFDSPLRALNIPNNELNQLSYS